MPCYVHVGPTSPRSGPKDCDEPSIHMHLLSAAFQVTFVSPYFSVGNAAGAAIQITWLYNSRDGAVEEGGGLAMRMQPTFT